MFSGVSGPFVPDIVPIVKYLVVFLPNIKRPRPDQDCAGFGESSMLLTVTHLDAKWGEFLLVPELKVLCSLTKGGVVLDFTGSTSILEIRSQGFVTARVEL